MRIDRTIGGTRIWCDRYRAAGLSIGFVPTLGGLHDGHASLIRESVATCDRTVVSVFLNPTQFGPNEDLDGYPQTLAEDEALCRNAGAHLVFLPAIDAIYPEGFETWVNVENTTGVLCGLSRPHHFRGVATIVSLLLEVVRPDRAFFGQKDYQQAQVIRRMVCDLKMPTDIRVCPIVRESDGLAMSSRNRYLNREERRTALALHRALEQARSLVTHDGERNAARIRQLILDVLDAAPGLRVDYVDIREAENLSAPVAADLEDGLYVIAVAAHVGRARLIDNEMVVVGARAAGEAAGSDRGPFET